ncbi:hypothetical protein Tco_0574032 [Tanacetum coccineum]
MDMVILRATRKNDGIQSGSKNSFLLEECNCLVEKAKRMKLFIWHEESGYVNFKNINKLVKGNLVRGLPSRHSSCHSCWYVERVIRQVLARRIEERTVREPLELLHMDLFGPVSVESVNRKKYCLVVTDDCRGKVSTYDDVEDLDDQQFIVHNAAQNKHSEERTADKEVPLPSEEQALHDELVSLMHQESNSKVHNDAQRNAFEEEKRRIALKKGTESANSTLTLSTANTPSHSTGNTLTDSDDDVPKDGVFSTNSFDDENTDNEEVGAPD